MDYQVWLPLFLVITIAALVMLIAELYFRLKIKKNNSAKYSRQLTYNVFWIVLLISIISASPLNNSLKGQILALIGIIISGAIALSSTNLLGNTLAGVMLKINKNFKSGDFISVNEYTGKVAARTLLNIEIQTFDRGLTYLPNLYLVSHPIKVFPQSGVFVSVEVSLGYDIPRQEVQAALLQAAKMDGIENAFVEVKKLLDFSVLYSLNALVVELESYVALRSKLHSAVMDELHRKGIEIVSPNFMNTRAIDQKPVLPEQNHRKSAAQKALDDNIDELLFEKANQADQLEMLKSKRERVEKLIQLDSKNTERVEKLQQKLTLIDAEVDNIKKDMERH